MDNKIIMFSIVFGIFYEEIFISNIGVCENPKDRNGKWFKLTGEELLARAICHETDHLDGHVFTEKVTEYME